MSRALASLPRSESKARFFSRLHLDVRDPRHRQIYTLMKDDASAGRARILALLGIDDHSQDQTNGERLSPGRGSPSITTSRIPERVMNDEILHIYHHAGPATKILYELAFDPDHPQEPNWIIRWMLWHVFRYRDGRQVRAHALPRQHLAETPSTDDDDDDNNNGAAQNRGQNRGQPARVGSGMSDRNGESGVKTPDRRYDPVRDQWSR